MPSEVTEDFNCLQAVSFGCLVRAVKSSKVLFEPAYLNAGAEFPAGTFPYAFREGSAPDRCSVHGILRFCADSKIGSPVVGHRAVYVVHFGAHSGVHYDPMQEHGATFCVSTFGSHVGEFRRAEALPSLPQKMPVAGRDESHEAFRGFVLYVIPAFALSGVGDLFVHGGFPFQSALKGRHSNCTRMPANFIDLGE